jgi:predicted porin
LEFMMKKLMLSVLTLAALPAMAQTASADVTLYGLADIGYFRTSNTPAGTQNQIASGMMEGSRWGLRGNEDLGGGYRALFTIESRVELDTGAVSNRPISGSAVPSRLLRGLPGTAAAGLTGAAGGLQGVNLAGGIFDRQAFVGLVTPVGGFLLGRQYTPAFQTFGAYDINETQSAASPGGLGQVFYQPVEIRRNNAVQYVLRQGGISASVMHAFGEAKTATTPGSSGSLTGMNASYSSGSLSVGLGYNASKDAQGNASLKSTVLGASYSFGAVKVSSSYMTMKDNNPALFDQLAANPAAAPLAPVFSLIERNLRQDANLMHIGGAFKLGTGTMKLSYNRLNDKTASNADSTSYGATYTYPFSKRTDLNGVIVRVNNKGLGQAAPGGAGFAGGVTSAAGVDSTGFGISVRHRF